MTPALCPRHVPVLGNLPAFRTDPLGTLLLAQRMCGDAARVEFPGQRGHLLFHPDGVRAVLVDHARDVSKDTPGFDALRLLLNNGLLTSDGAFWLRQRRIAQPAFHRARIFALGARMVELTQRTADVWAAAARVERVVDVADAMMRLTLVIVADTMLGIDVEGAATGIGRAITHLMHDLNERIVRPWLPPLHWPTSRNRRFHEARDTVRHVIDEAIARKRRHPDAPGADFLRMLIEARDEETGEGMTDEQLLSEVGTIFAAGHETTANLLTWTWHWLSRVPQVRRRLCAELDTVLGDRVVTAEDYNRLPYTRAVLNESLRLSPPVWFLSRRVLKPFEASGVMLPAGSLAFLSPYVTHRHPDLWENPEGFDPDRFLDGADARRPTLAFFPFGAGPRKCIGETFALVEATLILATLARRFAPELIPGRVPDPEPVITLRPRGGLPMRMRFVSTFSHGVC
jgi:cytochrome P450